MGLVGRTDGRRYHCQFLPVSVTLFHVLIISAAISVIAANNITTSFPTTPFPDQDECAETCDTCKHNNTNIPCTMCKNELTLNPADNCIDILIYCDSNCTDECYTNGTDTLDCQCLLRERSAKCKDCVGYMYGTCVKADDCPPNTEAKDGIFKPNNMTVCVECNENDMLFGYCVERYMLWIVLVPVGIFLVLIILVVVVVCLICRRRKRDLDVEEEGCSFCCIKHGSKKPEVPMQPDYPTVQRGSRGYQYDGGNSLQMDDVQPLGATQDDIYGNVDDQDNVLIGLAPEPEQMSLRPPLKPPQNRPLLNHPQNNGALNDSLADDTQDALYGNDDSIRRGGGGSYIPMKGNIPVEQLRYPSQPSSRHVSESEDQPLYGNDPKLFRHETAPPRRPPSIPLPKTSSTLPGRINQGYDDDDDDPTDDYPEFLDDEDRIDSLPTGFAPPPPINHNKTDISGGGGQLSELQQKLTKIRKESLSDLPEEPPPPIPSPTRTAHPMHPSPARKPPPMPQGGQLMSDLQRKLSSSLNNRPDAFLLPSKIPSVPALPSPRTQEESDSDEVEENYEFVDYKDGEPLPESPTRLNTKRPPLAPPKSPKRKDSSTRPPIQTPIKWDPSSRPQIQTPVKKDPSSRPPVAIPTKRTNRNIPPPLPTSPKPELQEVYEVVETADDTQPDRPRMPPPGAKPALEQDEIYEAVDNQDNPDFGDDYVVTQVPMVSPKPPATLFQEADDIYQNEPMIKGKSGHGRYRNLPADKNPPVKGKEGGYTKWTPGY